MTMLPTKNPKLQYDAILIPSGGLDAHNHLHPWVKARFDLALTHDQETQRYIPLSRGTPYKKQTRIESEVGRDYLISQGVSPNRITIETTSLDTVGNAYFCRTQITDPQKLAHLLIITSAFHLPRTQKIFDWIFHLPPQTVPYSIHYQASSDSTVPPAVLTSRTIKETAGITHINTVLIPRLTSMPQLKHWLFTEHIAYAPGVHTFPILDPETTESY